MEVVPRCAPPVGMFCPDARITISPDRALACQVNLAQQEMPDLVAGLRSPNGWVRDKVQQELLWRNDKTALPFLRALAVDAELPETIPHVLGVMEELVR